MQVDGVTYTTESQYCTENDATVLLEKSCTVPISVLLAAPYLLPYGSSIQARVTATNIIGPSVAGEGNGAVILTVPTAPLAANYQPETTNT
jgi:hypothetical protein